MKRNPPDVLITTPESLYLIMTSQAREMLTGAETVIVDEIHAVAQSKRGAHLALTLERLSRLVHRRGRRGPAAHRALGDAAPARDDRQVPRRPEARVRDRRRRAPQGARPRDRRPGRGHDQPGGVPRRPPRPRRTRPLARPHRPAFDGGPNPRSIWPAIYPELLRLVREHTSTIIFVNSRRGAERLAKRLNELANQRPEEELPATEHAGNEQRPGRGRGVRGDRPRPPRLARPRGARRRRGAAEVGQAPLPRRDLVARAGDRHGRRRPRDPGRVAEVGHPRAAARRPRRPRARPDLEGPHLPQVPRRPARVRGRRAAHARGADRGDGDPPQPARRARPAPRLDVRQRRVGGRRGREARHRRRALLGALARAARERPRHARRALPLGALRRAAPAHRLGPHRGHDPRPQGRPPARRHQRRHDPRPRPLRRPPPRRAPRRRARRGDGLRGAPRPDLPARRLDLADRGDHARPRHRHPGSRDARARCRSGAATASAAPPSSAARSASSRARRSRWSPPSSPSSEDLDERAATNLVAYLREQQEATRVVPSDETLVVERFRDEIGDWRLCVLSPWGGRVHAAWGLALSAKIAAERDLEADAIWSDDGICIHLPDADEPPPADLVLIDPDRARGPRRARALDLGAVRRPLSRERLALAADPARLSGQAHAAVAAAPQGAEPARGRERLPALPGDPRDLPRVPARRARPARARVAAARPALAQDLARRGRDADRLALRLLAALRLRRDLHVRGRHAQRRAPRRRPRARPRPAARAARPGGAARADRPRGARGGRGLAPAPHRGRARVATATRSR